MFNLTWVDGLILVGLVLAIGWVIRRIVLRLRGARRDVDEDDWGSQLIRRRGARPPRSHANEPPE